MSMIQFKWCQPSAAYSLCVPYHLFCDCQMINQMRCTTWTHDHLKIHIQTPDEEEEGEELSIQCERLLPFRYTHDLHACMRVYWIFVPKMRFIPYNYYRLRSAISVCGWRQWRESRESVIHWYKFCGNGSMEQQRHNKMWNYYKRTPKILPNNACMHYTARDNYNENEKRFFYLCAALCSVYFGWSIRLHGLWIIPCVGVFFGENNLDFALFEHVTMANLSTKTIWHDTDFMNEWVYFSSFFRLVSICSNNRRIHWT